jgi:hypothetical protein
MMGPVAYLKSKLTWPVNGYKIGRLINKRVDKLERIYIYLLIN